MGSSGVNLVRRHSAAEEVAPELTGSRRVTRRVGLENVFVWCVARVITSPRQPAGRESGKAVHLGTFIYEGCGVFPLV